MRLQPEIIDRAIAQPNVWHSARRERFTLIASLIWLLSSIGFLPIILRFFTVQFVDDCPPLDYPPGSIPLEIPTCKLMTHLYAFTHSFSEREMALLAIFAAVWLMVWVMLQPYWTTEAEQ